MYLVDELGSQHYATSWSPNHLFRKDPGGTWAQDDAGYNYRLNETPTVLSSDRHGYLYVGLAVLTFSPNKPGSAHPTASGSSGGILWRQALTGGAWSPDTSGLNNNAVFAMATDTSGSPIVGTFGDGLYRRSGTTWSKLPSPPGLSSSSVFALSVDAGNMLFAAFTDLVGTNYVWRGVYSTPDLGASWTYAGLDSIPVKSLQSFGDTTFAMTYTFGVYRLNRNGVTSVPSTRSTPMGFALEQNYPNPFNPATLIRYTVAASKGYGAGSTEVKLVVYDILGREVAVLVNGKQSTGVHKVRFDAKRLSSGVYFYRLTAGQYTRSRRMVLLK